MPVHVRRSIALLALAAVGLPLAIAPPIRAQQAFPDSPASEAGLARSQRVLEIGGVSLRDLVASGAIVTALSRIVQDDSLRRASGWQQLVGAY